MDLYKEILIHALECGEVKVTFPQMSISEITEGICYMALQKIKDIVHDESLDDEECFMKIEKVIEDRKSHICTGVDRQRWRLSARFRINFGKYLTKIDSSAIMTPALDD